MRGFSLIEFLVGVALIITVVALVDGIFEQWQERKASRRPTAEQVTPPQGWDSCEFLGLTPENRNAYRCGDKVYVR